MAAQEKNLYTGSSASVLYTDRRDFYLPNDVKELWSDTAPFLTAVANNNQFKPKDPLFKMFEYKNYWRDQRFTINDTSTMTASSDSEVTVTLPASTTTNTIGLGSGSNGALRGSFLVGLVCAVHTNDPATNKPSSTKKGTVLITTYTSDTEIKVKTLSTTTFTLASGDWFVVIGNAHGEGSESPEPWADELKVVWGSCQIFRTPLQITKTLMEAALRGEPNELIRLRRIKSMEHKMQRERTFLFGESVLGNNLTYGDTFGDTARTDADGEMVRTTTGLRQAIVKYGSTSGDDQNIFEVNQASYTYANFVDDCEKIFQYQPLEGSKQMWASAKMLSFWSKMESTSGFAKNSGWTVNIGDVSKDKLGFNYRMLDTPHGMIQLVPTPALTISPYNGEGIITDVSNLRHAVYEGDAYHQNIKTDNAPLIQKDEYYSYDGLGIQLIPTHKIMRLV